MAAIATPARTKTRLSVPWLALPKFHLGQLICYLYTVDDDLDPERHGLTYHNVGIITGITWNPDHWCKRPGWVYTIYLVKCGCYPADTGLDVEVAEKDLVLVKLGGKHDR